MQLLGGRSEKDRIEFHTKYHSATAIRSGNLKIEIQFENRTLTNSNIVTCILTTLILIAPILVTEFVLIPLTDSPLLQIIWIVISLIFYTVLEIYEIFSVRKDGGKEFLKNHGAEHMVYAAYTKLKRIPSVKEAMRFSRLNKNCGVTIFSSLITYEIINIFLYMFMDLPTSLRISWAMLILCFDFALPFNFISKFSQLFTTSKPDKHNIELAIAALRALEKEDKWST